MMTKMLLPLLAILAIGSAAAGGFGPPGGDTGATTRCDALDTILHGTVGLRSTGTDTGARRSFSCVSGFVLQGPPAVQCARVGTGVAWAPEPPTCVPVPFSIDEVILTPECQLEEVNHKSFNEICPGASGAGSLRNLCEAPPACREHVISLFDREECWVKRRETDDTLTLALAVTTAEAVAMASCSQENENGYQCHYFVPTFMEVIANARTHSGDALKSLVCRNGRIDGSAGCCFKQLLNAYSTNGQEEVVTKLTDLDCEMADLCTERCTYSQVHDPILCPVTMTTGGISIRRFTNPGHATCELGEDYNTELCSTATPCDQIEHEDHCNEVDWCTYSEGKCARDACSTCTTDHACCGKLGVIGSLTQSQRCRVVEGICVDYITERPTGGAWGQWTQSTGAGGEGQRPPPPRIQGNVNISDIIRASGVAGGSDISLDFSAVNATDIEIRLVPDREGEQLQLGGLQLGRRCDGDEDTCGRQRRERVVFGENSRISERSVVGRGGEVEVEGNLELEDDFEIENGATLTLRNGATLRHVGDNAEARTRIRGALNIREGTNNVEQDIVIERGGSCGMQDTGRLVLRQGATLEVEEGAEMGFTGHEQAVDGDEGTRMVNRGTMRVSYNISHLPEEEQKRRRRIPIRMGRNITMENDGGAIEIDDGALQMRGGLSNKGQLHVSPRGRVQLGGNCLFAPANSTRPREEGERPDVDISGVLETTDDAIVEITTNVRSRGSFVTRERSSIAVRTGQEMRIEAPDAGEAEAVRENAEIADEEYFAERECERKGREFTHDNVVQTAIDNGVVAADDAAAVTEIQEDERLANQKMMKFARAARECRVLTRIREEHPLNRSLIEHHLEKKGVELSAEQRAGDEETQDNAYKRALFLSIKFCANVKRVLDHLRREGKPVIKDDDEVTTQERERSLERMSKEIASKERINIPTSSEVPDAKERLRQTIEDIGDNIEMKKTETRKKSPFRVAAGSALEVDDESKVELAADSEIAGRVNVRGGGSMRAREGAIVSLTSDDALDGDEEQGAVVEGVLAAQDGARIRADRIETSNGGQVNVGSGATLEMVRPVSTACEDNPSECRARVGETPPKDEDSTSRAEREEREQVVRKEGYALAAEEELNTDRMVNDTAREYNRGNLLRALRRRGVNMSKIESQEEAEFALARYRHRRRLVHRLCGAKPNATLTREEIEAAIKERNIEPSALTDESLTEEEKKYAVFEVASAISATEVELRRRGNTDRDERGRPKIDRGTVNKEAQHQWSDAGRDGEVEAVDTSNDNEDIIETCRHIRDVREEEDDADAGAPGLRVREGGRLELGGGSSLELDGKQRLEGDVDVAEGAELRVRPGASFEVNSDVLADEEEKENGKSRVGVNLAGRLAARGEDSTVKVEGLSTRDGGQMSVEEGSKLRLKPSTRPECDEGADECKSSFGQRLPPRDESDDDKAAREGREKTRERQVDAAAAEAELEDNDAIPDEERTFTKEHVIAALHRLNANMTGVRDADTANRALALYRHRRMSARRVLGRRYNATDITPEIVDHFLEKHHVRRPKGEWNNRTAFDQASAVEASLTALRRRGDADRDGETGEPRLTTEALEREVENQDREKRGERPLNVGEDGPVMMRRLEGETEDDQRQRLMDRLRDNQEESDQEGDRREGLRVRDGSRVEVGAGARAEVDGEQEVSGGVDVEERSSLSVREGSELRVRAEDAAGTDSCDDDEDDCDGRRPGFSLRGVLNADGPARPEEEDAKPAAVVDVDSIDASEGGTVSLHDGAEIRVRPDSRPPPQEQGDTDADSSRRAQFGPRLHQSNRTRLPIDEVPEEERDGERQRREATREGVEEGDARAELGREANEERREVTLENLQRFAVEHGGARDEHDERVNTTARAAHRVAEMRDARRRCEWLAEQHGETVPEEGGLTDDQVRDTIERVGGELPPRQQERRRLTIAPTDEDMEANRERCAHLQRAMVEVRRDGRNQSTHAELQPRDLENAVERVRERVRPEAEDEEPLPSDSTPVRERVSEIAVRVGQLRQREEREQTEAGGVREDEASSIAIERGTSAEITSGQLRGRLDTARGSVVRVPKGSKVQLTSETPSRESRERPSGSTSASSGSDGRSQRRVRIAGVLAPAGKGTTVETDDLEIESGGRLAAREGAEIRVVGSARETDAEERPVVIRSPLDLPEGELEDAVKRFKEEEDDFEFVEALRARCGDDCGEDDDEGESLRRGIELLREWQPANNASSEDRVRQDMGRIRRDMRMCARHLNLTKPDDLTKEKAAEVITDAAIEQPAEDDLAAKAKRCANVAIACAVLRRRREVEEESSSSSSSVAPALRGLISTDQLPVAEVEAALEEVGESIAGLTDTDKVDRLAEWRRNVEEKRSEVEGLQIPEGTRMTIEKDSAVELATNAGIDGVVDVGGHLELDAPERPEGSDGPMQRGPMLCGKKPLPPSQEDNLPSGSASSAPPPKPDPENGGVVVKEDGKLSGTGRCDGREVVCREGSTISPGHSPGTLAMESLTMEPGSTLDMEVASADSYDRIDVAGHVELAGTLNVIALDSFEPSPDDTFTFMTWETAAGSVVVEGPIEMTVTASGIEAVGTVDSSSSSSGSSEEKFHNPKGDKNNDDSPPILMIVVAIVVVAVITIVIVVVLKKKKAHKNGRTSPEHVEMVKVVPTPSHAAL